MSQPLPTPDRSRAIAHAVLALVGIGGFAFAGWRLLNTPEAPAAPVVEPTSSVRSARTADAEPDERRARVAKLRRDARLPELAPRAPADPSALRRSTLLAWMRLRVDHASLAVTTEAEIQNALDEAAPIRDLLHGCTSQPHDPPLHYVDLSAQVVISRREIRVNGWGCDADDPGAAGVSVCACVVNHLPSELHATLPRTIPDAELTDYDDLFVLRVWP